MTSRSHAATAAMNGCCAHCVDPLILDDREFEPLAAGASHDLLELLDDRYSRRSTIVTGELRMGPMASPIGGPTYADAALDRFIQNAWASDLAGENLRGT
ncbi:DNA replication protein DnaC [Bradyrhizobium sp. USDA 4461]